MADPSKTATAVITLLQAVTVALSPLTVSLAPSGTQHFTPTVSGASNTAVTWSVNPSVGTISPAGLYTAPSSILTSQTITLTAQSVADSTKSASAAVTLSAPVSQDPSFIYYVDSANGSDSNPGTLAQPWKTIAKVNATPLLPGQSVAFQAGGVWREQLTVPSSGRAKNPITFTSYGSGAQPIITGADLLSGFTNVRGNIWTLSLATQPNIVLFSGTIGKLVASQSDCTAAGDWYWSGGTLSIYSPGTPSDIEAGQRIAGIDVNEQSFITISNLSIYGANGGVDAVQAGGAEYTGAGVWISYAGSATSSHITISNITSQKNYNYDLLAVGVDNLLVTNNTFGSVPGGGVYWGDAVDVKGIQQFGYSSLGPSTNVSILNNVVNGPNSRGGLVFEEVNGGLISGNIVNAANIDIEPALTQECNNISITGNAVTPVSGGFGISAAPPQNTVTEANISITNNTVAMGGVAAFGIMLQFSGGTNVVSGNQISGVGNGIGIFHSGGPATIGPNNSVSSTMGTAGIGIFVNQSGVFAPTTSTVTTNTVSGVNTGVGVYGTGSITATVSYNTLTALGAVASGSAGLETNQITSNATVNFYYNTVWNFYAAMVSYGTRANVTFYNNSVAQFYYGLLSSGSDTTIAKNNIFAYTGSSNYAYPVQTDGGGTLAADYNLYYVPNHAYWTNGTYFAPDFAAWQADSWQDANGRAADPLFSNPSTGAFTLQPGSRAIGAGVYIPGVSTANPPNIGRY